MFTRTVQRAAIPATLLSLVGSLFLPNTHAHDADAALAVHGTEHGVVHRHADPHAPATHSRELSPVHHRDALWLAEYFLRGSSAVNPDVIPIAVLSAVVPAQPVLQVEPAPGRPIISTHDPPWTPTGLRAPPPILS